MLSASADERTVLSPPPPAPAPSPSAFTLAESVDLMLARAFPLERTIFPDLPTDEESSLERFPKRLSSPLSLFLSMVEGASTPLRIRFRLAEVPLRELMPDFSLPPIVGLRPRGSSLAPPPPPPPPAPSNGLAFLTTAEPEDLTAGLLDPYEEPLDMVLLLPHGGATARRTVRVLPVPERRLPRLELALDRLLVEGRAKVRLLLEELPRRLDVLGFLIVGVFIVGVLVVRDDLEDPLVVLGRR